MRVEGASGAKRAFVLVALALGAGAAATCIEGSTRRGVGERCDDSGGCADGLTCDYGRCRAACSFDRDCPAGGACVDTGDRRVCWYPDETGEDGEPCPRGLAPTADGRCGEPCMAGEPRCADGRVCSGEACIEAPAAADGDGDADSDSGADGDADGGSDADDGGDVDAQPPLGACLDLGIPGSTYSSAVECDGPTSETSYVELFAAFMMETYLASPLTILGGPLELDTGVCALPEVGIHGCRLQAGGVSLCAIAISALTVDEGATLRVVGDLPLVLLSEGEIRVDGTVTAAAEGAQPGPGGGAAGGKSVGCPGMPAATNEGAGGGGLGSAGGDGGCVTGTGGGVCATCTDHLLLGGYGGGAASSFSTGSVPGGSGGGGLYLMSRTGVVVGPTGWVRADGGGGASTDPASAGGGGGGGSGGTLVLDAPYVRVDGRVTALGGMGGAGAANETAVPGGYGGGETSGSPGSAGSCDGGEGTATGGGGGGGAGRVFVHTASGARSGSGRVVPDVGACTSLVFTCGG